jgi:hypothetical protein
MTENMEITIKDKLYFDSSDRIGMLNLMAQYGESEEMMFGENEQGEATQISIFLDHIVLVTMQHNGWVRKNIYYRDSCDTEELYECRWK